MVDSSPVIVSTILEKICCHFSPAPTRRTPGCFSSKNFWPDINARYAAQGRLPKVYLKKLWTERSKMIDKYAQMKRFHYDHRLQCYIYDLMYVDPETIAE